jgi:riboflavin synthase
MKEEGDICPKYALHRIGCRGRPSGFFIEIMFTGIIEETGKVNNLRSFSSGRELFISGEKVSQSLKAGDSISVDGVCLTVTEIKRNIFRVFLSGETFAGTNLGKVKIGGRVNLERAVVLGDRMGGHLITGHIDAMGTINKIRRVSRCLEIEIDAPKNHLHLIVPKGSIAIDGVSLTIAALRNNIIKTVIIPHTAKMTTFIAKKPGDRVNLEYDLIGKYMWRFYENRLR